MKSFGTALLTTLMLASCSSSDSGDNSGPDNNVIDDPSDNGDEITINEQNHTQILKDVIAVLNLRAIDQIRAQANAFDSQLENSETALVLSGTEPTLDGLTLASQSPTQDGSVEISYSCNGEGSLTSFFHDFGSSGLSDRNLTFDNCLTTDNWRHGQYQFHTSGNKSDRTETFTNYVTRQESAEQSLTGEWTIENTYVGDTESQSWRNATFTSTGTADDIAVDAFNWHRQGGRAPIIMDPVKGYAQDLEGNAVEVELEDYSAELLAEFTFSNTTTGNTPIDVAASLTFSGGYFTWENHDYPVSDLGSPLTISSAEDFSADVQTVENPPRDSEAQWQAGELVITAADGSSVSLRPSGDDKALVDVELNASGDVQTYSWSDGFVIDCPSKIDGCGDAALEF